MLEMIRPKNQRPWPCRLGPTPRRPANLNPPGELREKRNKRVKDTEGLALPQVRKVSLKSTSPRLTLSRPKKPNRKFQRRDVKTVPTKKILLRSCTIIAT